MKNHTVTYALFGLTLLFFVLYFVGKSSAFPNGEPIKGYLNDIVVYAQQDKWKEAESSLNKLIRTWEKNKYLLAVNYAEADYSMFTDNIKKMQGAIWTKNDTETISQAQSTLELWQNFIKVIPEP